MHAVRLVNAAMPLWKSISSPNLVVDGALTRGVQF